jgi:putative ABC transport system ATP-binding protein
MSIFNHPLIRLEGVAKIFVTDEVETHALNNIDLEINAGEYVSIAGPSGCGKSTLLAIIGLLESSTQGNYWIDGKPVAALLPTQRAYIRNQKVGYVFQSFNLISDMTVYENVELTLIYQGVKHDERKKRVMTALDRVGMANRSKHMPNQLSGGQQQRVAVARAIVGRPRIVLADEPTGNLDSKSGQAVMELLSELHWEGTTICMVTHDPRYSSSAERTIHLSDGTIVEEEVRVEVA